MLQSLGRKYEAFVRILFSTKQNKTLTWLFSIQTQVIISMINNHKQNEQTTYKMGWNICKQCNWQGLNFQNIQTADTAQQQQKTQCKNGQKTQTDISPKKTNRHMKRCWRLFIIREMEIRTTKGIISHWHVTPGHISGWNYNAKKTHELLCSQQHSSQ